ncbi:hypothetical protein [Propionibacterium australiense]|uniref:hypothetical protein n=1 Tax=Propionibacterium australiense TaxID=119981 RepID=UPI000F83378D|nr:hypothetical protein [Propionibacterium australiense]
MPDNFAFDSSLDLMLCSYAQDTGGEVTIVGGGLSVYPGPGRWYLAGVYVGSLADVVNEPAELAIVTWDDKVLLEAKLAFNGDAQGDGLVTVPIALPLPPFPEGRVENDHYFVSCTLGGQFRRIPFRVQNATSEVVDEELLDDIG